MYKYKQLCNNITFPIVQIKIQLRSYVYFLFHIYLCTLIITISKRLNYSKITLMYILCKILYNPYCSDKDSSCI